MKKNYSISLAIVFILLVSSFNFLNGQCSYNISTSAGTGTDLLNWSGFHISNVQIDGDNSTSEINNSNSNMSYTDYTGVSVDMTAGNTYNFSIINDKGGNPWGDVKVRIWIDYNNDGNYTEVYDSGPHVQIYGPTTHTISGSFTIDPSATTGSARLRIQGSYCTGCGSGSQPGTISSDGCDFTNTYRGDVEDYTINITAATSSTINITGGGNVVTSGSTTTSVGNNTGFGAYDIDVAPLENTFVITNNNATNLTLTLPIADPSGVFTISDQPDNAVIVPGGIETFTVAFDPVAETNYSATVSVVSNDASIPNYTFLLEGEGTQIYPDTDGDGIPDTLDGDDDNDGILDFQEQLFCINSPTRKTTDVIFLNEDFGAGTTRETIAGVSSAYCFQDGTGTGPCGSNINLFDGSYVAYYQASDGDPSPYNDETPNGEVASWADRVWYPGLDHTPGDTNGRMAMFNADNTAGVVFYETTITGVTAGVNVTYGFSIINLDRADLPGVGSRSKPSVLIEIIDPTGATIASVSSGDIEATANYVTGDWVDVSATFSSSYTEFTVRLTNEKIGGSGNDLAIDDIIVKQTLCDIDEDGVADAADLDNDDDGIPNIVELGFIDTHPDTDKDGTLFGAGWVDSNKNGVHDAYETPPASFRDTDLDGVPDYLDPDSDNDGIFDTVEYDGKGDVDITGDGVGDGSDSEDFVSKIDNDDVDGDGILAIIDTNDNDADGNDFGSSYPDPLDDDNDGIPNYRDVDSADNPNDFLNGSDIDTTIYAALDSDNDGAIDGDSSTDPDQDGILDVFDTDNSVFGSPRDLDGVSYSLFFDGRNDYVEDSNVIGSGDASIMGFVKSGGANTATTDRVVVGQSNFYIRANTDNTISVFLNGSAIITSTVSIADEIWTHLAATTTSGNTTLYINGIASGTSTTGTVNADTSSFTIGRLADMDANYFRGEIEEVRVFSAALAVEDLERMVYQELDDTSGFDQGMIIPQNISTAGVGSGLLKYYKMDTFKDDIVDNKTTTAIDIGSGAQLYNIKDIYFQTAPLPYETVADGNWTDAATWLHGDVWDITRKQDNSDDVSIVHIKNNITLDGAYDTQGMIGLIVDSGAELTVPASKGLFNNWHLKLDGTIDLEGESQLVQTVNSIIDGTSIGVLERDQQGTENLYTYNYWSSPVHTSNPNSAIDGDESYTVGNVLRDGEDPLNPASINFVSGNNYDGDNTATPIEIADYWIWKYSNLQSDNYALWQHVRSTGSVLVGEGFTMKGPGTGAASNEKNYVFTGTPNNGTIELDTDANNDYLVGNPYPSAIDANEFLNDNTHTNGALYFWDHFGGGSHTLKQYQGGYATRNLSGGTAAPSHPSVSQVGTGTKTPGQYIPVGQGFFVVASSTAPAGSKTKFENDQRVFQTEVGGTNSLFLKSASKTSFKSTNTKQGDIRPKFRIGYKSPTGYERQLLVTVDENASSGYDWGYDAPLSADDNRDIVEDMSWILGNRKYVIQGIDAIDPKTTILPLSVKTKNGGIIEIDIDGLENISNDTELYLKDIYNNSFHDLRASKYITTVTSGVINDRFEIVFASQNTLSDDANAQFNKATSIFFSDNTLVIVNPKNHDITNIELVNTLGQVVLRKEINTSKSKIEIPVRIENGVYITTIISSKFKATKKVMIN